MKASRLICIALLLPCHTSIAQTPSQIPTLEQLKTMRAQQSLSEHDYQLPVLGYCTGMEPKLKAACNDAYIEYFQYQGNAFKQKQVIYAFEQASTKVIFAMVLLLVSSGLIFAALQFWYAFSQKTYPLPLSAEPATEKSEEIATKRESRTIVADLQTDLELSATGLKIKSSILGLLLLVISMGFFYLYIKYVYPVQEGTTTQQPAIAIPSGK